MTHAVLKESRPRMPAPREHEPQYHDPQQSTSQASQLTDGHGRTFSYLRLSITDVCNFSCNYCLPDGYHCDDKHTDLSLEEIQQLASVFARQGIRKIRITGGEPAIRKDLVQIIALLKATPGIEQVVLTTNGYKLDEQVQGWIEAGLDGLNVSIDSLDPRLFQAITGHDRLDEILRGLDKAMSLGLTRIKVNAVLLKSYNLVEFDHFLRWIKQTPISLRFIELMETGDNKDYFKANHVSGAAIEDKLLAQGWVLAPHDLLAGPAKEYSHPDYAGSIGLIMPYSKDFCASCNRLRISSRGQLHTCLFGDGGYDLRPYLHPDDEHLLVSQVNAHLEDKPPSHYLQQGKTGAMKHLSLLGG